MFSKAFILFIERYVAAPAVAIMITHGLVDSKNSDQVTQLIGEVAGWGFIFLVYVFTHNRKVETEQVTVSGFSLSPRILWDKFSGWVFLKQTTTTTTEQPQQLP